MNSPRRIEEGQERRHYPVPCHLQPAYAALHSGLELPHAERAATRIVSLPMSPTITEAQVSRTCEVLHEAVGSSEIGAPS
jgi:dTDP-4-amino-4,6-dideoxygalactose transaminase